MAYRKPHYRKDGTFVNGSWNSKSRKNTSFGGGDPLSIIVIILLILFCLFLDKCC